MVLAAWIALGVLVAGIIALFVWYVWGAVSDGMDCIFGDDDEEEETRAIEGD